MSEDLSFSSVVFAGGGSRCLWQVGFWDEVAPRIDLKPKIIAGVSAGATMACLIFSGRFQDSFRRFKKIMAENRRNFYPMNLVRGMPVFPHLAMYRTAVLAAIDDTTLETLQEGPEIRILLTRPPAWAGPRLGTLAGFLCYTLEKKLWEPVHPQLASRFGFTPEVATLGTCRTPDDIADLLLQSSCTPPFTPVLYRHGRPVLDGGLIDNVPVRLLDGSEGNTLILMTRRYPPERIPKLPGRIYVQPSEPIGIYKWDYTNPEGLQDAYNLGRYDGNRFVKDRMTG
jgi:predicted acylesterase/phospholipase RssA